MTTVIRKTLPDNPNHRNNYMTDFQIVSRKQVELAIQIRAYRNKHELSQTQFAQIASVYGRPQKIKFATSEISSYENYKNIPSEKKMFVLLMAMHLNLEDIEG